MRQTFVTWEATAAHKDFGGQKDFILNDKIPVQHGNILGKNEKLLQEGNTGKVMEVK